MVNNTEQTESALQPYFHSHHRSYDGVEKVNVENWWFQNPSEGYRESLSLGWDSHGRIAFQQMIYADQLAVTVHYHHPQWHPDHPAPANEFHYTVETNLPGLGEHRMTYKTVLGEDGKAYRTVEQEETYDTDEKLLSRSGNIKTRPVDDLKMGHGLKFAAPVYYKATFGLSSAHANSHSQNFENALAGFYLNIHENFDGPERVVTINRDRHSYQPDAEGVLGDQNFLSVDFHDSKKIIVYFGDSPDKFECRGNEMIPVPAENEKTCTPF